MQEVPSRVAAIGDDVPLAEQIIYLNLPSEIEAILLLIGNHWVLVMNTQFVPPE